MTTDTIQTATDPIEALVRSSSWRASAPPDCANIYLGSTSGSTRARRSAPATPPELAARAGLRSPVHPGMASRQAVSGFPDPDGSGSGDRPASRSRTAPPVLVRADQPRLSGRNGRLLAAVGRVLPTSRQAFRTGAGVPLAAYGPGGVGAQSALNRPAFVNFFITEWLPRIPTSTPASPTPAGSGLGRGFGLRTGLVNHRTSQGHSRTFTGSARQRRGVHRGRPAQRGRPPVSPTGSPSRSSTWPTPSADWRHRIRPASLLVRMPARLPASGRGPEARSCRRSRQAVRSWSWTSGPPEASPRPATRSSGSSPRPAPSGVFRRDASAPTPSRRHR